MAKGNRPGNAVRLQRCPEYRDPRALMEHGIAAMVRISETEDAPVALQASVWLIRYAEALMRTQPSADDGNAKAIAELRALYAKASPDETLLLDNGAENGRGDPDGFEVRRRLIRLIEMLTQDRKHGAPLRFAHARH